VRRGFTLVELLVVIGIIAILFTMTGLLFFNTQAQVHTAEGVGVLIADIEAQQSKAMAGQTVSLVRPPGYGVHFESDRYILFSGSTYDSGDTNNQVVYLPGGVTFGEIDLSNNNLIFTAPSGEVASYDSDASSVTISGGETNKTVKVNSLGVVVEGL